MVYQWDRATETITDYIFLGSEMIVEAQVGMGNGSQNVNHTNVGYTGHQWDNDTGLNYMQARYYDPLLARFYSNDPLGFRDIHSFNRYAYANNNPYRYVDPDGQHAKSMARAGRALTKNLRPSGGDQLDLAIELADAGYTGEDAVALSRRSIRKRTLAQNKKIAKASTPKTKKARNKPPAALKDADGRPHSIVEKSGSGGQCTTHNGDGTLKQYRGEGKSHGTITRPNIKENQLNTKPGTTQTFVGPPKVRKPRPEEIPGGSS